ncbi:ABC transporter substrate-binding protein [Paenibacillus mendelii]|uniref:ABC transporter substrate-binding protein n=1 Tax=Paenibacillus mendelii TaxID=206163 RepID=A0ABV6J9E0_9BACL|nr:extracellular solute-binding protein [Paenibacillus mendelii]MCQ6559852.1 extracellular solute-binding protein [Paenibacillus mendelii]
MKGFGYKRIGLIGALTMSVVLSGCSFSGGGSQNGEASSSLKVMYYDERSFYSQLGMVYSALHPEVDITVVTQQQTGPIDPQKDMKAEFDKFIAEEQPDVLMLSTEQLTQYAEDGKLLELDTLVEDKDYNKETLIPGLIDYVKEIGGGKIYGLPSNFYSQAIFYNKDLFDKYGITLPEDRMSWDKLFDLAQRFPTDGAKDKRVYGLSLGYNSDLYQLGTMIGASQNLSMVNATSKQVTIDTSAWKNVFQSAWKGLKSGALYTEDPNGMSGSNQTYEDYLLRDPFISGRAAMKLEGAYFMDNIKEAQTRVKDKAIQNWDIVTVPVNPESPDTSPNMSFNQIFAINSKSVNTEAAKDFVSYVTGEEYARVASKVQNGGFQVRTNYLKDDGNHNMQAFYSLKPAQSSIYKDYEKLPQEFFMQFMTVGQEELKGAFDGKKSLDEALALVQTRGQQIMDREQAKEKNKPAEADVSNAATTTTTTNAN